MIALLTRSSLLLAALCVGQPTVAEAHEPAQKSIEETRAPSAAQWQADLDIMVAEMERRHRDLYHTISEEEFAAAAQDLRQRIPSMQRHQIIVEMMRIVAKVGDGHTNVSPHRDPEIGFSELPLRFYWFDDGLYVRAAAAEHAALVGAEVIAFGGVPVEEALERAVAITAHDNQLGARALAPVFLQMPEILHALGLAPDPSTAVLTVRTGGGMKTLTVARGGAATMYPSDTDISLETPAGWVDAARASETPLWLEDANTIFRSVPLPGRRALYVQLNQVKPMGAESLEDLGHRIRTEAQTSNAQRVILDLRLNRGGNGDLLPPLVRTLIQTEDDDTDLFVLIGRSTFSAAQFLTDHLDRFSQAVLIGEPTGSKPNVMGDSRKIVLPNSGITVRASIYYWQLDPQIDRPWTAPDVAAPLTFSAYAAGRDPALEAALSYSPEVPLNIVLAQSATAGSLSPAETLDAFMDVPANRYVDVERELLLAGYRLFNDGNTDEALTILELMGMRFPTSASAQYYLASAYAALGRPDDALSSTSRALALDPEHDDAIELARRLRGS